MIFDIGPDVCFYEGGITMITRYCPVFMYCKDKPDKFCADLFTMENSNNYFIYNFDVYQEKIQANIDVHSSTRGFITTPKSKSNDIFTTKIANDSNRCR